MDEKNKEKIVKFFREMLEVYDFQIIIDTNKDLVNVFRLNHIQKGNLGGIEEEEFLTLADIIYRLEIYHKAYVYTPLEEKDNEKLERGDWDLVAKRYLESDTVAKVLSEIGTKEYLALINENKEFKIQDIIKILDEDEKFYKSVCKKYMCAMPKVTEYFKENDIDDLMGYGSDKDEGLFHLSSMYKEIMDKLNIKYENIYTEDGISDGKYVTVITMKDNTEIKLDTSAWNGIETVTENIATIYEIYDNVKENLKENKVEKEEDFDYEDK